MNHAVGMVLQNLPRSISRTVHALEGINKSLAVMASPDDTIRAMRAHAAEHDCVLELRLIDFDVFGVHCPHHPEFRHEWRTT